MSKRKYFCMQLIQHINFYYERFILFNNILLLNYETFRRMFDIKVNFYT